MGKTVVAAPEPCRQVSYGGNAYTVCSYDPAGSTIRIYGDDLAGKPYGSFQSLEGALWQDRTFLSFGMNGGMYDEGQKPVGLFIENGIEKKPIILGTGWGNFHLLPNGVFYLMGDRAGVMESKAFVASGLKPLYATQSGPMLVIDGRVHPSFLPDSDSFKIRNGVGVDEQGAVVFVLSNGAVRFYDFALLFRDVLGCRNALFLDGTISSVDIPQWQRRDDHDPMGPIIGVTETLPLMAQPSPPVDPPATPRANDPAAPASPANSSQP